MRLKVEIYWNQIGLHMEWLQLQLKWLELKGKRGYDCNKNLIGVARIERNYDRIG